MLDNVHASGLFPLSGEQIKQKPSECWMYPEDLRSKVPNLWVEVQPVLQSKVSNFWLEVQQVLLSKVSNLGLEVQQVLQVLPGTTNRLEASGSCCHIQMSERSQVFNSQRRGGATPCPCLWGWAKPSFRRNLIADDPISDLILCVRCPQLTTISVDRNKDWLVNRALPSSPASSSPQKSGIKSCHQSPPLLYPSLTPTYLNSFSSLFIQRQNLCASLLGHINFRPSSPSTGRAHIILKIIFNTLV